MTRKLAPKFAVRVLNQAEGIIEGYMVLWRSVDEYNTWFDPNNPPDLGLEFLPWPLLYEHWLDENKDPVPVDEAEWVGTVTDIAIDRSGIKYTAKLKRSAKKFRQILSEIKQGILGTSTSTADHTAYFDSAGRFVRWLLHEVSLTKTPGEQRMLFDNFRVKLIRSKFLASIVEGAREAPGVNADLDRDLRQDGGTRTMEEILALLQPLVEEHGIEAVMAALQQMTGGEVPAELAGLVAPAAPAASPERTDSSEEGEDNPAPVEPEDGATPPATPVFDEAFMARLQQQLQAGQAAAQTQQTVTDLQEQVTAQATAMEALQAQLMGAPPAQQVPRSNTGVPAPVRDIQVGSKYDHLSAREMAVGTFMVRSVRMDRPGWCEPLPEAYMKAMAHKVAALAKANDPTATHETLRSQFPNTNGGTRPIRADELMQSDLSTYGDEWSQTFFEDDLWASIRALPVWEATKAKGLMELEVPRGSESVTLFLEGTDPTWYVVPQTSDEASGVPTPTLEASKVKTRKRELIPAKIGVAIPFTGELDHDSAVAMAPFLRKKIDDSAKTTVESNLINGDTDITINTNINLIDGTPTATTLGSMPIYTQFNGWLLYSLITKSAMSFDVSGGQITDTDFLELLNLYPESVIAAPEKLLYIMDARTSVAARNIPSVKTRDVNTAMTIENGAIKSIWGIDAITSSQMALADSAGKIPSGGGTLGRMLLLLADQWRIGWSRRITTEMDRNARADSTELVAYMRFGMTYNGEDVLENDIACAAAYNINISL